MDCDTCKAYLAEVVRTARPRRLLEAVGQGAARKSNDVGGEVGPAESATAPETALQRPVNLECRVCPDTGPASGARAFLESPPAAVVLCANRLGSRREVEEAVVHELIHAYDYLVAGIDLLDCRSLAYSEVRAARAAECSEKSRSFMCSYFKKGCVRSTATASTENLFPGRGAECVSAIFHAAYDDQGPHRTAQQANAAATAAAADLPPAQASQGF